MRRTDQEQGMSRAEDRIETWLAAQVLFISLAGSPEWQASLPSLAPQAAPERLAGLRVVLDRRPTLADRCSTLVALRSAQVDS